MRYPELSFDHLRRLSDDVGTREHARGSIPLRDHGYCLDDVARGQGRSENQGAESTLALLSTLQHRRPMDWSLRGR